MLRLTTQDGAIFQNTDPISMAMAENSIRSTVLDWVMPPLAQRYMETCAQTKTSMQFKSPLTFIHFFIYFLFSLFTTDANPFIKSQIELIASTQSLSLNDQMLSSRLSKPLFKALHFQSNITKIDLTNSFIEDEGFKYLVQAFPTMKQIATVNVTGNLITNIGIKYFSNIFDDAEINCLPELNTLILNENPLQNQCLNALEKVCRNLNQLTTLHLKSTELTDLQGCDLRFGQLLDIDFSFNQFTPTGLLKAIDKLNSCKLEQLRISFCGQLLNRPEPIERNLIDALTKALDAGSCANLQQIHLNGLNLNDVDCWQIVQSLKRSKTMQVLSLRDNSLLTKVTWKMLLEKLSIHCLYLEGCNVLLKDFNDQDEDALAKITNCSENIRLSLSTEAVDAGHFDRIKRIWNSITQYGGKIFQHGRIVWLTTTPTDVDTDIWEYCRT